jgi:hypothetical protein
VTISRRTALKLISASTLGAAAPRLALAGSVPRPLKFKVMRDGRQIGSHSVGFERAADGMRVSTAIDLEVKIAFISAFRFSHRGVERWEGDRLVELKSTTNENGERFEVSGMLAADNLRITAPNGTTVAPVMSFTTNDLWNRYALQSRNLVDAHHGGVVGIVSRSEADEEILVGERKITASRYRIISPFLAGTIWYDGTGRWRRGEFEIKGERLEYQPADSMA